MAATNSTWLNFLPGQTRGPAAQGMYVFSAGTIGVSTTACFALLSSVVAVDCSNRVSSQRPGRQTSVSEPQMSRSICTAALLMKTAVFGGIVCDEAPSFKT